VPKPTGLLADFDVDDLFDDAKAGTYPEWKKVLFEIFLRSPAVHGKYSLGEYAESTNEGDHARSTVLDVYRFLPDHLRADIKQAFYQQQSQNSVDHLQTYDEDLKFPEKYDDGSLFPETDHFCARWYRFRVISSRVDCCQANRRQGYWSLRAFVDLRWLCRSWYRLIAWYLSTAIPALWSTLIVLYIVVSGLVQLRVAYPEVIYLFYAIVMTYLLVLWGKQARYSLKMRGADTGADTWWEDVSIEKTYPGMVRAFSLDYWSMLWACLIWILVDSSGGWGAIWTLGLSVCPSLCFAVHCTLSSTTQQQGLGLFYILSGVAWYLLWLPTQMKYVESKAGEEGRKVLGEINKNIGFMTNSIIAVFGILVPEIAAFLYHKNGMNLGLMAAQGWIALALCMEFAHIGAASLIFMGIAKYTADANRAGFDEFGLCIGNGWDMGWV